MINDASLPKPSQREMRHEEGFNPGKNSKKAPSDSVFGHLALGPLNSNYFPDHEREIQASSTGFRDSDGGYILIDDVPEMLIY